MKISKALIVVSILAGLLAAVQAGAGLFWSGGSGPFAFTTLHGQTVQLNGQGIYFFDTHFKAPINRGTDAVTLFLCLPLQAAALILYGRGSLRGGILLTGLLAYLTYNAASVALGTAYNNLFLVYTAYFSASLFAFVLALAPVDHGDLAARLASRLPHGGTAAVLGLGGLAVCFAWLTDIIAALLAGGVPDIASYTTEVTYVLDLGIIAPCCFLAVVLLLRRVPLGYLLSLLLLTALVIVGIDVIVQSLFQLQAGITLSPGMFIGKVGSFAILSFFATWMLVRFYRGLGYAPKAAK